MEYCTQDMGIMDLLNNMNGTHIWKQDSIYSIFSVNSKYSNVFNIFNIWYICIFCMVQYVQYYPIFVSDCIWDGWIYQIYQISKISKISKHHWCQVAILTEHMKAGHTLMALHKVMEQGWFLCLAWLTILWWEQLDITSTEPLLVLPLFVMLQVHYGDYGNVIDVIDMSGMNGIRWIGHQQVRIREHHWCTIKSIKIQSAVMHNLPGHTYPPLPSLMPCWLHAIPLLHWDLPMPSTVEIPLHFLAMQASSPSTMQRMPGKHNAIKSIQSIKSINVDQKGCGHDACVHTCRSCSETILSYYSKHLFSHHDNASKMAKQDLDWPTTNPVIQISDHTKYHKIDSTSLDWTGQNGCKRNPKYPKGCTSVLPVHPAQTNP